MAINLGLGGGYEKSKSDYERKSDFWNPQQKRISRNLYGRVLSPGFGDYESIYSGKPTDIEQMGINQLRTYGQAAPQLQTQTTGALSRALTGEGYQNIVDPAAAENLYKSIEERTLKDILPQAVTAAAGEANVGGMLHSGTGQKLITDEIGKIVRALSEQLSTLKYSDEQTRRDILREREGRQLSAVPQTSQVANALLPLLQYGGAERNIAGTAFENPLTKLALAFLGLRGQEQTSGSASSSGWDIRGRGGISLQ